MRKVKPTQADLAYIWAGFSSQASAESAISKLRFCVRNARDSGRSSWKYKAERKFYREAARDALIDARYWQAALVKHAA